MTGRSSFDNTGSSFESFLQEEGILEQVDAVARERLRIKQDEISSGKVVPFGASVATLQERICQHHSVECVEVTDDQMLGFATSTRGKIPINGLRHRPSGNFSGWYLWCGEEFSERDDFFAPLHARHVYTDHPEIAGFLGLPPGYRFLVAGDFIDVWYDASLVDEKL